MNERWIGGTVRHSYAFGRAAILLAGLFFVIAISHSIAQGTGSIGGTVVDASQAAIAGSQVTLTNTATAQTRATSASDQGLFEFPNLLPGVYKVSVNKTGFKVWEQPSITLTVAQHITVYPQLQIGSTTEQVEITSQAAFRSEERRVGKEC